MGRAFKQFLPNKDAPKFRIPLHERPGYVKKGTKKEELAKEEDERRKQNMLGGSFLSSVSVSISVGCGASDDAQCA